MPTLSGTAAPHHATHETGGGDVVDVPGAVPSGGVILWSGAIVDIPSGWYLCNGANSTPDLRDRFVIGAGFTYDVAATGGATSHSHGAINVASTAQIAVAQNSTQNNLPPYYALAYIMKE